MASEAADLEAALKARHSRLLLLQLLLGLTPDCAPQKTKQQERAAELKAQIKELERTVAKQKQQAAAQQQEAQEKVRCLLV